MRSSILLSVAAIGVVIAGQAFAGPMSTGTVNLNFAGNSSDTSCAGAQTRESFTGTVTDASQGISDATLNFSICDIPQSYAGGVFLLTVDADDTISGTITATDLGDVITDEIDYSNVAGSFDVTGGTGEYASAIGYTDVFTASTQEGLQTGQLTGSFIVGTPEPATMALTGLGVFLIGYSRKRRLASRV